jgi:Holliday junction resolvase RusA-like endonuclease
MTEPTVLSFKIEGVPPNTTAQGKRLNRATGRFFASKEHAADMEELRLKMRAHRPKTPLEGPIQLMIVATWPYPKNTPKGAQIGKRPKLSKPDADNFAKGIQDCLVAEGFFFDDAKVYGLTVLKFFGPPPSVGIEVTVWAGNVCDGAE